MVRQMIKLNLIAFTLVLIVDMNKGWSAEAFAYVNDSEFNQLIETKHPKAERAPSSEIVAPESDTEDPLKNWEPNETENFKAVLIEKPGSKKIVKKKVSKKSQPEPEIVLITKKSKKIASRKPSTLKK